MNIDLNKIPENSIYTLVSIFSISLFWFMAFGLFSTWYQFRIEFIDKSIISICLATVQFFTIQIITILPFSNLNDHKTECLLNGFISITILSTMMVYGFIKSFTFTDYLISIMSADVVWFSIVLTLNPFQKLKSQLNNSEEDKS